MLVETLATSWPNWILFLVLGHLMPLQDIMKSRLLFSQKENDDVADEIK